MARNPICRLLPLVSFHPTSHIVYDSMMYCNVLRAILFALLLQIPCLMAQKNRTVQESDSRITYTPGASWMSLPDNMDSDGRHMMTMDRTAFATFSFTGTALYFVHPLWPYLVTTAVSLDNGTEQIINMQDPYPPISSEAATANSRSTLIAAYLPDEEHTVKIYMAQGPQNNYAILDALVYTYSDLSVTTNDIKPKTSPSNDASNLRSQNRTLIIAMSIVAGVLSLLLAVLLVWWCFKRRDNKQSYQAAPGKEIHESPVVPAYGYVVTQPSTNDFGTRPGPNLYQVSGDGSTSLSYHSSNPSQYSNPSWYSPHLPNTAYDGIAPDLNSTLVRLSAPPTQPQALPPSIRYYQTPHTLYDPYSSASIAAGGPQPISQVTNHPVQSSTTKSPIPAEYPAEPAPPPVYVSEGPR